MKPHTESITSCCFLIRFVCCRYKAWKAGTSSKTNHKNRGGTKKRNLKHGKNAEHARKPALKATAVNEKKEKKEKKAKKESKERKEEKQKKKKKKKKCKTAQTKGGGESSSMASIRCV